MGDIIKDFVKKQTTPVTIGVPKARPQGQPAPEPVRVEPAAQPDPAPATVETNTAVAAPVRRGHVGRPKSDIEKVKLSLYIAAEAKAKLVRIQHQNYKSNLNDLLTEAINDLLKKYGE